MSRAIQLTLQDDMKEIGCGNAETEGDDESVADGGDADDDGEYPTLFSVRLVNRLGRIGRFSLCHRENSNLSEQYDERVSEGETETVQCVVAQHFCAAAERHGRQEEENSLGNRDFYFPLASGSRSWNDWESTNELLRGENTIFCEHVYFFRSFAGFFRPRPLPLLGAAMTEATIRKRHRSSPSTSAIPDAVARPARPRAQTCHPEPERAEDRRSSLLDSLDLSASIPNALYSLREYLMGKVEEAEFQLSALKVYVEESELEDSGSSGDNESDEWEVVTRKRGKSPRQNDNEPERTPSPSPQEVTEAISTIEQFIKTASGFLDAIRSELPFISGNSIPSSPLLHFQLSPDTRLALDHFLEDHPLPAFPLDVVRLRTILDDSKTSATNSATALLTRVLNEMTGLQQVLVQLTSNVSLTVESSLPSTPPLPPLASVREYFSSESDRLSKTIHSISHSTTSTLQHISDATTSNLHTLQVQTTDSLNAGIAHLREEATELTTLLSTSSSAAYDEAARIYHAALEGGRKRLLRYEELPQDWKNNQHILSGYRFIGIDRWGAILRSAFQFHNETINIHSHFFGFLSLLYLACFILPNSPAASPDAHWGDMAIAALFIGAGMKCLLCSTAWHLLSGCASEGWHRGAACVDYVGISGLIAASVMGMEVRRLFSTFQFVSDLFFVVLRILLSTGSRRGVHDVQCVARSRWNDHALGESIFSLLSNRY